MASGEDGKEGPGSLPGLDGLEPIDAGWGDGVYPDDDGYVPPPPMPTGPRVYDLTEEEFWSLQYLPVGLVISFASPGRERDGEAPCTAVLVEACAFFRRGVQVVPKYLGASTKAERSLLEKSIKAHGIHLCYPAVDGCPVAGQSGCM